MNIGGIRCLQWCLEQHLVCPSVRGLYPHGEIFIAGGIQLKPMLAGISIAVFFRRNTDSSEVRSASRKSGPNPDFR